MSSAFSRRPRVDEPHAPPLTSSTLHYKVLSNQKPICIVLPYDEPHTRKCHGTARRPHANRRDPPADGTRPDLPRLPCCHHGILRRCCHRHSLRAVVLLPRRQPKGIRPALV